MCSGCQVHEAKSYCRNTGTFESAALDQCVIDYLDGEYINAKFAKRPTSK